MTPEPTSDLPAVSENTTDLFAGAAPDDYVEPIPKTHGQLTLDSGKGKNSVKPGTWRFMGHSHDTLQFVFLKGHMYRSLFEAKFDPKSKNRVVCMSWDGVNAFGQARLGWHPGAMGEQTCGKIDAQGQLEETCPHAEWRTVDGKNHCPCPEKKRWLLVCYVPEREVWLPAYFEATGGHVKRWQHIYDQVVAMSTKKLYVQRLVIQLRAHKDGDFWNPSFGDPVEMPDPDWELVYSFIKEHGIKLFAESLDHVKHRAHDLANEDNANDS